MTVVVVGNILGTKLDTPDPQVDGVSLSVATPHTKFGAGLGTLAKEACAGKDPCRVVYFWGIKGQPTDVARFDAFKQAISDTPTIKIVAEIEDQYATDTALAKIQNLLQTTSAFDVIVGTDQSVKGAQIALEEAGKLDGVALIGLGGSEAAIAQVKAGTWFGGVMTAPHTEGLLAAKGLFELLNGGQLSTPNGINPLDEVPNGGLFKADNVDAIVPEWPG
jgi:ribose transport system substrate-binding protein